ncbi:DEAD/DEAH box helicase [Colwellia sp. 1_MG-2023]|uniref:DEAD/DEAH box helicase n=1 Tax=unclassified Colwellia TaxID=196834 RepID=UPI001C092237|nr:MULTISPECIES: DEAD/DEAH box helicase [unclassified Colwellia]MBU2923793.1 DEAD/DEAH box helicase [Colwellia sp. C2M11]MDO6651869.1 DEAD/DEAH box helicase [Colwellia sp. 3_MG-2023]MDO6667041.1 DEAD/DEAH box helicase [Colwellia sp. 2_MG-2023]MDO6691446.1 DEAD/DEAH box helicase [Colwellia sp. 1_MG-2023]
MKFSSIPLINSLQENLKALEYTQATDIQVKAIPLILAGNDVMARAKTGTGKTAAFALPILNNLLVTPNRTRALSVLVLAPTRELVQQIYTNFNQYSVNTDIKVVAVFGGVSIKPQVSKLAEGVDVLVATPGRLLDLLFNKHISLEALSVLVFDEADRILDLGFKAEIDRIMQQVPEKRQTLLFSATFDDSLYKFSKLLLKDPQVITIDEKTEVADSVEQLVYTVDADRKRELLSYLIGSRNWKQVLIFTRTKQTADELAKELCKDGIKAKSLHGDKSQGARDKALLEFKEGKTRALVATDVAARGIDIADLGYVVNYELPYVAEDYVHRIGRTGRAGKSGLALSLVSPSEEWLLTAIEKVIDDRLLQQWLPGYEPDLTKVSTPKRPESKKKARDKALRGRNSNNRRRK